MDSNAWQIRLALMAPKWLVKWILTRALLHATNGKWNDTVVDKITAVTVMERWEQSNEK